MKPQRMFAFTWPNWNGYVTCVRETATQVREDMGRYWDNDPKIGWRKVKKMHGRVVKVHVTPLTPRVR